MEGQCLLTLKCAVQKIKVLFRLRIHPALKLSLDAVLFLLFLAQFFLPLPLMSLGFVYTYLLHILFSQPPPIIFLDDDNLQHPPKYNILHKDTC